MKEQSVASDLDALGLFVWSNVEAQRRPNGASRLAACSRDLLGVTRAMRYAGTSTYST